MVELVYVSCALASLLCAILLIRSYRASRTPLLLWSSLCFVCLALNNTLLLVDLVITPSADLSLLRALVGLAGLLLLLFGLVWHVH